jgi:hypothetical protein
MAGEPKHNVTHHAVRVERRLALEIRSWKIAYAVVERDRLLDWGMWQFASSRSVAVARKLKFLVRTFAPSVGVARQTRRAIHISTGKAAYLLRSIRNEFQNLSIPFVALPRRDVQQYFLRLGLRNKHQIAEYVTDRFRELESKKFRARRTWDPEVSVVPLFDAVATAIAHEAVDPDWEKHPG